MTEPVPKPSSTTEISNDEGPEIIGAFHFGHRMYRQLFISIIALSISAAIASQRLGQQAIEKATFSRKLPAQDQTSPLLVKVEVRLDRAHFLPGQINGKLGENVTKALAAYADAHSLPTDAWQHHRR